jgi:hypothetical protein
MPMGKGGALWESSYSISLGGGALSIGFNPFNYTHAFGTNLMVIEGIDVVVSGSNADGFSVTAGSTRTPSPANFWYDSVVLNIDGAASLTYRGGQTLHQGDEVAVTIRGITIATTAIGDVSFYGHLEPLAPFALG